MEHNKFKFLNKIKLKKYFHYLLNILKILLILIILYIFEKYLIFTLLYKLIYNPLKFVFPFLKYKNYIILKIVTILLLLQLQLEFLKLIIISVVFFLGGIFKKFNLVNEFQCFISAIIAYCEKIIEILQNFENTSENVDTIKYLFEKLKIFQDSYNFVKNTKNQTFELKNGNFDEELSNIFTQFELCKKSNFKNEAENITLIEALKKFWVKIETYTSIDMITTFFRFKITPALQTMEYYLLHSLDDRTIEKKCIVPNTDFNVYIISPTNTVSNNKKFLAIFCNQNALCCESYCIYKENINTYLKIPESTILIWNYTGFGLRSGITTFKKVDKDVNYLYEYLIKEYFNYKIVVHGASIGGYSSINLSKKLGQSGIDVLLIADRTYSDIQYIAQSFSKKYGKALKWLYTFLFPKVHYKSDNVNNYISLSKNRKMIIYNENDEIIKYNPASLIYNVTKKYYKQIILPKISKFKEYKNIINQKQFLVMELQKLSVDCNDKNFDINGRIFIQHLYKNLNNLQEFLMFFLVFAFPFNIYKEITYNKKEFDKVYLITVKIMKQFVNKHKQLFSDKLIELITDFNFLFIKANLSTKLSDNDIINWNYGNDGNTNAEFIIDESFSENLIKYFGYVHRLFCPHNGCLKFNDEKFITDFLTENKFIGD